MLYCICCIAMRNRIHCITLYCVTLHHVVLQCVTLNTALHRILLCADVDECLVNAPCNQTCSNTLGSYTCSCIVGFRQDITDTSLCNGKTTSHCAKVRPLATVQR